MDNHQILAKTGKLKEALINLYLNLPMYLIFVSLSNQNLSDFSVVQN